MTRREPRTVALPRMYGIYWAEDAAYDGPLHVDDAFGWAVEIGGRVVLVRWDAESRRSVLGTFASVERIVEVFGRREPLTVVSPAEQAVWTERLTTDNDAFAVGIEELCELARRSAEE